MQRLIEREDEEQGNLARLREQAGFAEETEARQQAAASPAARTERAGFWQSLRGENPVLHKELRTLFFPARQTTSQRKTLRFVGTFTVVALHAVALLGMREILKNIPPEAHQGAWYVLYGLLIGMQALGLMVVPLSRLPSAITREREKQTWNALLLSRLSPETILSGKLVAGLASALVGVLFILPLTALAAILGGVPLMSVGLGYVVLLAMSLLLSMTSLYASWRQDTSIKSSNEAGLWMMGLVFGAAGFWGVGSLLWGVGSYLTTGNFGLPMADAFRVFLALPALVNPYVALGLASTPASILPPNIPHQVAWAVPLCFLAFSTWLTMHLWKKMVKNFWSAPRDFTG